MITTKNFTGALITLGLAALLQSVGASEEFDLKTQHDPQRQGSLECLFGPSYWCKSMSNAVHCKAVEHCIQTAWQIEKYPNVAKGPSCSACTKVIHLVLKESKKHYSKDRLIHKLGKLCNMLSNPGKKSECKSKINSVVPLIMNSAHAVVNPHTICFALRFCLKPLVDTFVNEKEATINFEVENTDDQNEEKPKDSLSILYSKLDADLKEMHDTDAVDGAITLLHDQHVRKSEEPITVLNYLN